MSGLRQGWVGFRETVSSRAKLVERLKELAPLSAGGSRSGLAILGLDRDFLVRAAKLTGSATLAWLLAKWAFPTGIPIYAPITACFVALATIRASFTDAVQRVIAVVVGIGMAYFIGTTFGPRLWTIAAVVALGFLLAQLMRLPPRLAGQVPISGLLIMAIGATPGHAGERIGETLIGVAVSALINLVIAPPNHVTGAAGAVRAMSERAVDALSEMSGGIAHRWTRAGAAGWLQQARTSGPLADIAEEAVEVGADSLRLRPGAAALTAQQDRVRQAMDTLRVVQVQVRVVGRSLRDTADALADDQGTLPPIRMGADLLTAAAGAITAFTAALLATHYEERFQAKLAVEQALETARKTAEAMNADLADMTAANLTRGLHLGALVLETNRIINELETGLQGCEGRPTG